MLNSPDELAEHCRAQTPPRFRAGPPGAKLGKWPAAGLTTGTLSAPACKSGQIRNSGTYHRRIRCGNTKFGRMQQNKRGFGTPMQILLRRTVCTPKSKGREGLRFRSPFSRLRSLSTVPGRPDIPGFGVGARLQEDVDGVFSNLFHLHLMLPTLMTVERHSNTVFSSRDVDLQRGGSLEITIHKHSG